MSKYCLKMASVASRQDIIAIIWPGFNKSEMKVYKKVLPSLHLVNA